MLVDTDVCFCVVFVWEATGVPRGNPPAQPGDHMIGLSSIAHSVSIHRPCQYQRYRKKQRRQWNLQFNCKIELLLLA